jgi:hypothetical protein
MRDPSNKEVRSMAQIRTFPLRQAFHPDREPSLAELVDDPVTQAVMRRDGVTREALVRMLETARSRVVATSMARCCA